MEEEPPDDNDDDGTPPGGGADMPSDGGNADGRIVSLPQPWVRPIVRGKSKAPTEFGAKISISVVEGYTFVDRISFDAYNEGDHEQYSHIFC